MSMRASMPVKTSEKVLSCEFHVIDLLDRADGRTCKKRPCRNDTRVFPIPFRHGNQAKRSPREDEAEFFVERKGACIVRRDG